MHKLSLHTFATVFIFFFLAMMIAYGFTSLTTLPGEGDSLAYHLPIASSVLDGYVFHPTFYLGYYPSSAEVLLALLLLFHVPVNVFNIVALILLFFAAKKAGVRFGLDVDMASIFAVTICLLPTMLRWTAAQIIDIWLLLFYVFSLLLLQKPEKRMSYFILLGSALGLLVGAKYSGPLFMFGLIFVYFRGLLPYLSVKRVVVAFIPFLLFGLSWYIRNAVLMHNPIYPQPLFSLPGIQHWNIFAFHELEIILRYPGRTIDAFIAEYLLWFLAPLLVLSVFVKQRNRLGKHTSDVTRLVVLGIYNIVVFLFLPTTPEYNIIVSSIRYSYPAFVPFILAVFLLSQAYKKEYYVILFSLAGLLFLPSLAYRPKLLIVFLVLLIGYHFLKRGIINSNN